VLELEHRQEPHVRPFVSGQALPVGPQLDVRGAELGFDRRAHRRGHRVRIRLYAHAPGAVDAWKAHLLQVERLGGERTERGPLDRHRLADRLRPRVDHARLIGATPGQ
jgi:hypothetical protein